MAFISPYLVLGDVLWELDMLKGNVCLKSSTLLHTNVEGRVFTISDLHDGQTGPESAIRTNCMGNAFTNASRQG